MRHSLAEEFNYINPGIRGQNQEDFVISQYERPEQKMCSLDVVNSAAYLAFVEENKARDLEFSTEYFYTRRQLKQKEEDEAELVSDLSESVGSITPPSAKNKTAAPRKWKSLGETGLLGDANFTTIN